MGRIWKAVLGGARAMLVLPATASALVHCVDHDSQGCDVTGFAGNTGFQNALDAAEANPGADTVSLGFFQPGSPIHAPNEWFRLEDIPMAQKSYAAVLEALTPDLAARAFEHVSPAVQRQLLDSLPESQLARILNALSPDDRTSLLEREPPEQIERLLTLLTPAEQRVARSLLSYGAGTVGRLMTPDLVTINRGWTISQVLDHVRREESLDRFAADYGIDYLIVSVGTTRPERRNGCYIVTHPNLDQAGPASYKSRTQICAEPIIRFETPHGRHRWSRWRGLETYVFDLRGKRRQTLGPVGLPAAATAQEPVP